MIFWVILFLLVIAISFTLALRSMRDYQEIPQKSKVEYGLFLIRQTANFHPRFLDNLHKEMTEKGLLISLERLFKGKKAVLTIFGPREFLEKFKPELDLLELEDYTPNIDSKNISIWEVDGVDNVFSYLPQLGENDQFFWQVVLNPHEGKAGYFKIQIRAALYPVEVLRSSIAQMMDFYRLRSWSNTSKSLVVDSSAVLNLLKVN